MDLALKNIFEPNGTTTSYCLVTVRLSSTRYAVEDANGRIRFVEAEKFYPPGTSVIIQDGRITGRGNSTGKHRVYEV